MFAMKFVIFLLISTTVNTKESLPAADWRSLPPSLADEVSLTVPEIIAKYNYTVEVHHVTTQDGYILGLHRILPNRKPYKGSVLVMHGIIASSADWIITGPEHALGYFLSNEGYDVWLGNARGNRYSRNHTTLNPKMNEFWDFSWHEIGLYDIPAMIDYILEVTNQSKIFYIAHSQGCTNYYVLCSLRPEYNEKIRAQFSLAPVAFVSHMISPIFHLLALNTFWLEGVAKMISLDELLPKGGLISVLGQKLCGVNGITQFLCTNTLFSLTGFNHKELNVTLLPLILAHVPAGCATKQLLHFSQEINSGHFREYDYGLFLNRKKYNRWTPPDYDLGKITAPMYFFYSNNDWISSAKDVNILAKKVNCLKGKFLVADEAFDHLDYMFGIKANTLVYRKVLSLMTRH